MILHSVVTDILGGHVYRPLRQIMWQLLVPRTGTVKNLFMKHIEFKSYLTGLIEGDGTIIVPDKIYSKNKEGMYIDMFSALADVPFGRGSSTATRGWPACRLLQLSSYRQLTQLSPCASQFFVSALFQGML